jgi:hypothetical protein
MEVGYESDTTDPGSRHPLTDRVYEIMEAKHNGKPNAGWSSCNLDFLDAQRRPQDSRPTFVVKLKVHQHNRQIMGPLTRPKSTGTAQQGPNQVRSKRIKINRPQHEFPYNMAAPASTPQRRSTRIAALRRRAEEKAKVVSLQAKPGDGNNDIVPPQRCTVITRSGRISRRPSLLC